MVMSFDLKTANQEYALLFVRAVLAFLAYRNGKDVAVDTFISPERYDQAGFWRVDDKPLLDPEGQGELERFVAGFPSDANALRGIAEEWERKLPRKISA
jgi:hypothetical protein